VALTPIRSAKLAGYAAQRKMADELRALVARGVDLNARDILGRTALHQLATYWGRSGDWRDDDASAYWVQRSYDCLETLLELGADVTAADDDGVTLLHGMASHGDERALTRLLDAGADPNARTAAGETPLMGCTSATTVELLVARGADPGACT